jgi:hypothetical protein
MRKCRARKKGGDMDQRHQSNIEGSWAAVVAIVALLITCLLRSRT